MKAYRSSSLIIIALLLFTSVIWNGELWAGEAVGQSDALPSHFKLPVLCNAAENTKRVVVQGRNQGLQQHCQVKTDEVLLGYSMAICEFTALGPSLHYSSAAHQKMEFVVNWNDQECTFSFANHSVSVPVQLSQYGTVLGPICIQDESVSLQPGDVRVLWTSRLESDQDRGPILIHAKDIFSFSQGNEVAGGDRVLAVVLVQTADLIWLQNDHLAFASGLEGAFGLR